MDKREGGGGGGKKEMMKNKKRNCGEVFEKNSPSLPTPGIWNLEFLLKIRRGGGGVLGGFGT